MKRAMHMEKTGELAALCQSAKRLITKGKYQEGRLLVGEMLQRFPEAPEPHNLLGLLWEREGDERAAMRHFRAAWALDPSYLPARYNMERLGSFFQAKGTKPAYTPRDCPEGQAAGAGRLEYDGRGVGHVVMDRAYCVAYDANGLGLMTRRG